MRKVLLTILTLTYMMCIVGTAHANRCWCYESTDHSSRNASVMAGLHIKSSQTYSKGPVTNNWDYTPLYINELLGYELIIGEGPLEACRFYIHLPCIGIDGAYPAYDVKSYSFPGSDFQSGHEYVVQLNAVAGTGYHGDHAETSFIAK